VQALDPAALSALPDEYSLSFSFLQLQLLLLPPATNTDDNPGRSIFTCAVETPLVKAELFSLCIFTSCNFLSVNIFT
jgi:hypothetical protein